LSNFFSHPTAIIDDGASIGEGTKVWHWCHVSTGTVIGPECTFGQNVYIAPRVHIGKKVKVQNNVSIYDGVTLEDNVFCGPSMVFTNVINPRANIERKSEYRATLVKQGATIGANATVICGHSIGAYAFIGAGAVVTKDVPDFALVVGNPGKQIGWVSKAGVRLNLPLDGTADAKCPETHETYHLTTSGVKPSEGL